MPVISNCGYYIENISLFLGFHLHPIAKKVKSYVQDSNYFFYKGSISFQIYPIIFLLCKMEELRKKLDERDEKRWSTDIFVELIELVLKKQYLQF